MQTWKRVKRYIVKEISEDGLLKDPKDRWGQDEFSPYYETEAEAFIQIERIAGDPNAKYAWGVSFVVLTELSVELEGSE